MSYGRWGILVLLGIILTCAFLEAAEDLLAQGLAAQKAGKHEQAVELLGKYLAKHPESAEGRRGRAQAVMVLERVS